MTSLSLLAGRTVTVSKFLRVLTLKAPITTKSYAFLVCRNVKEASTTNSVDPDQTPKGAV